MLTDVAWITMSDLVPATLNLNVTENVFTKDAVVWDVTLYSGTDFLMCRNVLPPLSGLNSTLHKGITVQYKGEELRTWLCEWASGSYAHQTGMETKQPRKKQGRTNVMRRKKKGKYYIQHTYSPQPLPWPCWLCLLFVCHWLAHRGISFPPL